MVVSGGMKFRSDALSAYNDAWNNTPFPAVDTIRPNIFGFEQIFAVYETYAKLARYGSNEQFRAFFSGPDADKVAAVNAAHAESLASIGRLWEKVEVVALNATTVRFQGMIQEIIASEAELQPIIQDRINELTGAKGTEINSGVIEFYDNAANLVFLRLTMDYWRRVGEVVASVDANATNDPAKSHLAKVLVQTVATIFEKDGIKDCPNFIGAERLENAPRADRLDRICKEVGNFIANLGTAQDAAKNDDTASLIKAISATMPIVVGITKEINLQLKDLGLPIPVAS
jgi:hypothetical protein